MRRLLFSLLTVLVISAVYPVTVRADDDDKDLTEGVPFENIQTCVQSSGGFNADFSLRPIPPGGFFNHATIQSSGFVIRNPDGTLTSTFRSTSITLETTPPGNPINVSEGACTGPVETLPDGSRLFTFTCTGATTAGGGAGNTFVLTGSETLTLVDEKAHIGFSTSPYPPTIETNTVTRPIGTSFTYQRVCARAGAGQLLRSKD